MQVVDPKVSRRKFDRELALLRSNAALLAARGWWVMQAEFPIIKIAFAAVNLRPSVIAFAVKVDFTNYDLRPPSVRFVAPFADRDLLPGELPIRLPRRIPHPDAQPDASGQTIETVVELYQHYQPDLPGFLCLPGVREYHDHPAHTGDPWELHRGDGEGRLFNLLETIWRYGAAPLSQMNFQIGVSYGQAEIPA